MTPRTAKLREESLRAEPKISPERARLVTEFYKANEGRYSAPVMRAMCLHHICRHKKIHIGDGELIVGERGPGPKLTPTYPELTCHSLEDLDILDSRPKTRYRVDEETRRLYREEIIPYWRGRTIREQIFKKMSPEWLDAYRAGIFTEFMEQRAPGHTALDGKIYGAGLLDFKERIRRSRARLDSDDPELERKREALQSFEIACDALILLARRHAERARELAAQETRPERRAELEQIAEICERVPAHAPRTFREAIQHYWFCHIGVITELNGWDSFNPGHLDQHLLPFYRREIEAGALTPEAARELIECLLIKFNNHLAPPKVGVTAAESGTYGDFANINLGGLTSDGRDGSNELSHMILDAIEDLHLIQPGNNLQLSRKTPDALLKRALRVIRRGYGYPSLFNADTVEAELVRQGKSPQDAREGGCSGCVEAGAFGKEAYILTGYFNLPKILEITLHNGLDPMSGKRIGLQTGAPETFRTFDQLFEAYARQVRHFLEIKLRGNQVIEQLYAEQMPAPFLSVLISDCIEKARDYNAGGARYDTSYIQFVGIGSVTDSLSALRQVCFDGAPAPREPGGAAETRAEPRSRPTGSGAARSALLQAAPRTKAGPRRLPLAELVAVLDRDFEGEEALRQYLWNRTRKYGNDDDYADELMRRVFELCFEIIEGRPNRRGGQYHIQMLPTTCHIYFGSVTGAMPDGRKARRPFSEGISPVQGADRNGPTAVFRSAAKMDHSRTGGTLLNMKLSPALVNDEEGLEKWARLVRAYFRLGGHHVQFNVVRAETLRRAQARPEEYRDLIVRVAGYSDYFCDLSKDLQEEIIARTEHEAF